MQQLLSLILDRLDHMRMAVTGGIDGNAGREIQKNISVHIVHPQPLRLIDNQRVNTGVRRSSLINFFACGPGSVVLILGFFGMVPPDGRFSSVIQMKTNYTPSKYVCAFITIAYLFFSKNARCLKPANLLYFS